MLTASTRMAFLSLIVSIHPKRFGVTIQNMKRTLHASSLKNPTMLNEQPDYVRWLESLGKINVAVLNRGPY